MSFQMLLQRSTQKIDRQLEQIKEQSKLKKGLFFRRHTYTAQQLLDSEELKKVDAVLAILGDNYSAASLARTLTEIDKIHYDYFIERVEFKMNNIKDIIKERRPTAWERISAPINSVFSFLLKRLPKFIRGYLSPWIETIRLIEGI